MDTQTYRDGLAEFEKKNASTIAAILERHGAALAAADHALDELVCECTGEAIGAAEANESEREEDQEAAISSGEDAAELINNDGRQAQVVCILEGFGIVEGEAKIAEALRAPEPSSP